MKMETLKVGDIIVYRGKPSWFTMAVWLVTHSRWTHAEIVFKTDPPGPLIVGATWPGGVRVAPLFKHLERGKLFRFKEPLKPYEIEDLQRFIYHKLESRYDISGLLGFLTNSAKFNSRKAYFCSEFVNEVALAIGRKLVDKRPRWFVAPRHIAESPYLYEVGDLVRINKVWQVWPFKREEEK